MSHAQPNVPHPPEDHIDHPNQIAIDRSLIDRDHPQTVDPQHQSTSDRFLKSPFDPFPSDFALEITPLISRGLRRFPALVRKNDRLCTDKPSQPQNHHPAAFHPRKDRVNSIHHSQVPAITNSNLLRASFFRTTTLQLPQPIDFSLIHEIHVRKPLHSRFSRQRFPPLIPANATHHRPVQTPGKILQKNTLTPHLPLAKLCFASRLANLISAV
jgi:hypothetical protein